MRATWASVLLVLSACAAGPNYVRPQLPEPEKFRGAAIPPEAAAVADLPWFEVFQDPALDDLLAEAVAKNPSLIEASERIVGARARASAERAPLFPTFSLDVNALRFKSLPAFPTGNEPFNRFALQAQVTWEPDVFGRIRRTAQAADALADEVEELRRGVLVALVGDLAQTYVELTTADAQLQIARQNADARSRLLGLFSDRLKGGIGSRVEVASAEALLANAEAAVPDFERRIVGAENRLSELAGRVPGAIRRGVLLAADRVPPELPAGMPAELLTRRPDIRAAEARLRSATATIGAREGAIYPTIPLTATGGLVSSTLGNIFTAQGTSYLLQGGVNWVAPVLGGGDRWDLLKASQADARAETQAFLAVWLQALREVATAIIEYRATGEIAVKRLVAVKAQQVRLELALDRFKEGAANYVEVVLAYQDLFPEQEAYVQARANQLVALVQLYRALGGGWR